MIEVIRLFSPSSSSTRLVGSSNNAIDPSVLRRVGGYAQLYSTPTCCAVGEQGPAFVMFRPGAFSRSLRRRPVEFLLEHDTAKQVASTADDSLVIHDTATGLGFMADLPATALADQIFESIRLGNLREASIGFVPIEAKWRRDGNGRLIREVHRAELLEVSAVAHGAQPQAGVAAIKAGYSPRFAMEWVRCLRCAELRDPKAKRPVISRQYLSSPTRRTPATSNEHEWRVRKPVRTAELIIGTQRRASIFG